MNVCCQFHPHCRHVADRNRRRIQTVYLPSRVPLATLERLRDALVRLDVDKIKVTDDR